LASLLCVALVFVLSTGQAPAADTVYRFGVVPQQAATKLARLWIPVLEGIQAKTGQHWVFETAASIPEFERRLAEGRYDAAYMNPYHYTVFSRAPGYRAVAKQKGKRIQGIVVVGKNSPITALEDLDGHVVAFPAPAAFAASVLPRAHFSKLRVDITPRYVSSHDSVYQAVAKGLFVAGGGIRRTFDGAPAAVRESLRVLWRTDTFTPHAFAVHPRLPATVASGLAAALASLDDSVEGEEALKALAFDQGLEPARDADWNDVRRLGLELLEHLVSGS
jgi:phosphonate transport system substrate-binding protein